MAHGGDHYRFCSPLPTRFEMERFDPRQQQRLSFRTFQNCHKRQGIAYQRKGPCGFSFRIFLLVLHGVYISGAWASCTQILAHSHCSKNIVFELSLHLHYFFILWVWIVHMGHLSLLCMQSTETRTVMWPNAGIFHWCFRSEHSHWKIKVEFQVQS